MLPASNFGSGRFGRGGPATRSILTAVAAALVGTIIGGVSVLGVVLAVVEPPNHETRTEARDAGVTTGSSQSVIATAPRPAPADPSASAPAPQPAAAPNPSATVTTPSATQAPAGSSAPTPPPQEQAAASSPQAAWPDALTRRTLQDHANGSDTPDQSSTTQNGGPAATGTDQVSVDKNNDQASFDKKNVRDNVRKPQLPADRSVASRVDATTGLSNIDQAGQRAVSVPPLAPPGPAPHPAVAAQPAVPAPPTVSDTAEESSPGTARPLFDFFGLFGNDHFRDQRDYDHYRDERNSDDSVSQGAAPPPQQPASQTQYGAKARAVRQQRPNGTDQSGEAASANQQQRVIILQDQDDADAPRHNDNWGGFFGRNDWNDNGHRW